MVPVVRAFDLQDLVATGRGARDADRVHGRLGARVGEAHRLEVEAPTQLLGQLDGDRSGRGEVRAGTRRPLDRLDDPGVRVADDVDAEAAVEVEVLGAVDVPHV